MILLDVVFGVNVITCAVVKRDRYGRTCESKRFAVTEVKRKVVVFDGCNFATVCDNQSRCLNNVTCGKAVNGIFTCRVNKGIATVAANETCSTVTACKSIVTCTASKRAAVLASQE